MGTYVMSKSKALEGYTLIEPTVGHMMPNMDLIESNPKEFQYRLAKLCILKDGQPIGDALDALPISTYMKLISALMELFNGEGK